MASLTLARLASEPDSHIDVDHHPGWGDLADLARFLRLGLDELMPDDRFGEGAGGSGPGHGKDAHHDRLRLTKGRIRSAAICPAQVLAEVDPVVVDFTIAVGIACDAAAAMLAVHPGFSAPDGWYQAMEASLGQEHPDLTRFVSDLSQTDRVDFHHVVDDLCGSLPELLGDLRTHRPTTHHRIAVDPHPGVLLTGEIDLTVRALFPDDGDGSGTIKGHDNNRPGRLLAEVKSGAFTSRIADELAHYGLIVNLQHLSIPTDLRPERPPVVFGAALSLADLSVTPVALDITMLEAAARRVLETTSTLVDVDQRLESGLRPPTNPGPHCRWCRRAPDCADAPDLAVAEATAGLRPLGPADPPADSDTVDRAVAVLDRAGGVLQPHRR